jgi:hypothetical protein
MSFLAIGGTNVAFLAIGGTYVDLIEGGTNVGGTNVGRTNVGGRKVAASRQQQANFLLLLSLHSKVFASNGCIKRVVEK